MDFYLPSSWATPMQPAFSYGLNCGPSMHWASSGLDLFDLQQALYEAELFERRRTIQRERMRRLALQRECEAQAVAAARRMALALAAKEEALARQAQEQQREESARQSKRQRPSVHLVQMGPFVLEVAEPISEEDSTPQEADACESSTQGCGCDTLTPLGMDAADAPSSHAEPATTPEAAPSNTSMEAPAKEAVPVSETSKNEAPVAEPASTAPAPTMMVDEVAMSESSAPSHDTTTAHSQLLFSYDFPPSNTQYGRDVRQQIRSDRIAIEANTLNGGSIQIRGLWAKSAPPASRASSSRSAHVRDVDENGEEVLLPEDTDSESETDAPMAFDESAVLPLPPLDQAQALRAELNDQGFQLWLDM
ncbi:hypothetical protein MEQU1_001717 [Malassezia equina]|uniref:Uncharacterized protein n=1 Tax=Malassezia equina TaxID=1381935 RepID=A0AAF0J009_9BASI|nr:hypothetical protein MEQU1_001717 [Malassezia equina]